MSNKYKELVIGIQGPRGAGKDAYGSYLACLYMLSGVPCMSNMPIKGTFLEGKVESQELDIDQLFKFGQDFDRNILIYFSEIDKLVHRRRSITNVNLILNVLATQIRKKGITIIANAQDWFWLDDEWVFQTDILVNCKDMAYTSYGHDENIEEGHTSFIECYNLSGVVRAPLYRETGKPYQRFHFNTRAMWDKKINRQGPIYDTYKVLGVKELMSRVVLHKEEVHIYAGDNNAEKPDFSNQDISQYLPGSRAMEYITGAVDRLRAEGVTKIPAARFRQILAEAGYDGNPQSVGRYMHRLPGIEVEDIRSGAQYVLSPS